MNLEEDSRSLVGNRINGEKIYKLSEDEVIKDLKDDPD